MFNTNSRLQSQPNNPLTPFGVLNIGSKVICGVSQTATTPQVNGVNYSHVTYTPLSSSGMPGTNIDISASVSYMGATTGFGDMHLLKCADPLNPWSFNILVKDYNLPNATFSGNLQLADGSINDFFGSYVGYNDTDVQVTEGTSLPAGMAPLRGDLNVLENGITPLEAIATSPPDDSTTDSVSNPNPDAAQQKGNEMMQNLITHALDGTRGAQIMGPIPPIEDFHQLALLNSNSEFLQRGSVHTLCEQIKLQQGMDTNLSDHIAWKYNLYMNMLTSPPPLPGAMGTSLTWDPATMNGLDRKNPRDVQLLAKLQSQYQTVSMTAYEMGYTQQCNQWADFTPDAEYWFNAYAAYLRSDEHKSQWATQSVGQITQIVAGLPSPVSVTSQDKVRMWTNKLALLQYQAQKQAAEKRLPLPKLDIEPIIDDLLSQLHEHAAYSQIVDQAFIDEATKIANNSNSGSSPLSDAFKAELAKMSADAQEGGQELYTIVPHVLTLLNNPESAMYQRLRDYIASRSPGGVAPENLTIGQIGDWITSADFTEFETKSPVTSASSVQDSSLATLIGDDESTKVLNTTGSQWAQRVKTTFKTLFQVALHAGALLMLYSAVSGGSSGKSTIPQYQINTAICALATEGVILVGDTVGAFPQYKGAQWAIDKGGITKSASAWFTKSIGAESTPLFASAMIGDLSEAVRVLGVVGCIFNLVTSYNCMNATVQDPRDSNVQNETYFNKWSFSMGVVEGAAYVGGIIPEVIGFELGAAVCGPLGMAVGAAAPVVMLVQPTTFPMDLYVAIQDWMTGLPMDFGSWCPNEAITGSSIVHPTPPMLGPGQNGIPSAAPNWGVTGARTSAQPQPKTTIITANQQTYAVALGAAFAAYLAAVQDIDNGAWQSASETVQGLNVALGQVIAGGDWESVDELLGQTWTEMTCFIILLDKKGCWVVNVPNIPSATVPFNALIAALQAAQTQFWTYWINDVES